MSGNAFRGQQQQMLLKRWGSHPVSSPFSALPIDDLEDYSSTEEGDEPYREFATQVISDWFLDNFEVPEVGSTYDSICGAVLSMSANDVFRTSRFGLSWSWE